jgi:hypothetical protein
MIISKFYRMSYKEMLCFNCFSTNVTRDDSMVSNNKEVYSKTKNANWKHIIVYGPTDNNFLQTILAIDGSTVPRCRPRSGILSTRKLLFQSSLVRLFAAFM